MTSLIDMLLERFILDIKEHLEKDEASNGEKDFLLKNSDFIEKHFANDNLLLATIKEN